jgi:hypothetical protein
MYTGFRSGGPLRGSSIDYAMQTDKFLSDKQRLQAEQENKRIMRELEAQRLAQSAEERGFKRNESKLDRELREKEIGFREKELGLKEREIDQKYSGSRIMEGQGYDQQLTNIFYDNYLKQGLTPEQAQKRAIDDGLRARQVAVRTTDPETGRSSWQMAPRGFDNLESTPAERQQARGRQPAPPITQQDKGEQRTWWDEIEKSTGPYNIAGGNLRRWANAFSGGIIEPNQDFEEASNFVDTVAMSLRAFAENPRYAEGERKDILTRMDALQRSVTKGPSAAKMQAIGLDRRLIQMRNQALSVVGSPRAHVDDIRTNRQKVNDIDNLRNSLFGVSAGEMFNPESKDVGVSKDTLERLKKYE